MSEKRFTVDDDGIYDNQEKKHFKFIAYDWIDCDIYECCEKLNEQQSTISQLKEENERLKQEVFVYKKAFQQQVQRCTL